MTYKKTGRATGRPKAIYDLGRVEMLASRQLSIKEIAINVGIKPELLHKHYETKKEVKEAIERGRARSTAMCADVIMQAAKPYTKKQLEELRKSNPEFEVPMISAQHFKASLEYLNRFSDMWRSQPAAQTIVQTSGSGEVTVNSNQQPQLSDDASARAAWAFLQTKGMLPAGSIAPNIRAFKKSG